MNRQVIENRRKKAKYLNIHSDAQVSHIIGFQDWRVGSYVE